MRTAASVSILCTVLASYFVHPSCRWTTFPRLLAVQRDSSLSVSFARIVSYTMPLTSRS